MLPPPPQRSQRGTPGPQLPTHCADLLPHCPLDPPTPQPPASQSQQLVPNNCDHAGPLGGSAPQAAQHTLPATMPSVTVEVKWQKEVFKDVEVDLEQPPSVFKTQLFSLTGVPPERQKVMGVKGGLLKDDADWGKLGLKAGQKLTMMGSADKVPQAPTTQQTFMEDLPEEEQDTSGEMGGCWGWAGSLGGRHSGPPAGPREDRQPPARWRQRWRVHCLAPRPPPRLLPCCRRHEQVWRWAGEPGQHLLHEQHCAVPVCSARAAHQVRWVGGWAAGWAGVQKRAVLSHALAIKTTTARGSTSEPLPALLALPYIPPCSLTNYASAPALGGSVGGADGNHSLTLATRNLFQNLTRSAAPVPPMEFILSLRRAYPQFAQTSRWGCRQSSPGRGLRQAARRLSLAGAPWGHPLTPTSHACLRWHAWLPACPAPSAGRATTCSRTPTSAGPTSWPACATSSRRVPPSARHSVSNRGVAAVAVPAGWLVAQQAGVLGKLPQAALWH